MARQADALCLLCGGLHSGDCGTGQKKKSSPRTRKASSPVAKSTTKTSPSSTPSQPDTEASSEDVFGDIPTARVRKFKSTPTSETQGRDLSYESALRLLRPLVNDVAQHNIDRELHRYYPQDVDKRIALWKARHARKE